MNTKSDGRPSPGRRRAPHAETHAGAILRIRKKEPTFAQVPNSLLQDDRLQLDSRGLASFLLTLPADWSIVVPDIRNRLKIGEDRWQRMARELERAGYLARTSISIAGGTDESGKRYGSRWHWISVFDPDGAAAGALVDELGQLADDAMQDGDSARAHALRRAQARVAAPGRDFPGPERPAPGQAGANKEVGEKQEEEERTGPAARPPVDKSTDRTTPAAELRQIAIELGLSKPQLGKVLLACKGSGCRLQDVHSTVRVALQKNELRGERAVAYLRRCLSENPGRDWTAKARREVQAAELQAEQTAEAAQVAAARALLEAAGAAGVSIPSPRTGKPIIVRSHRYDLSSRLVELIDPAGRDSWRNAQLSEFVQALVSTAHLEGRSAQ